MRHAEAVLAWTVRQASGMRLMQGSVADQRNKTSQAGGVSCICRSATYCPGLELCPCTCTCTWIMCTLSNTPNTMPFHTKCDTRLAAATNASQVSCPCAAPVLPLPLTSCPSLSEGLPLTSCPSLSEGLSLTSCPSLSKGLPLTSCPTLPALQLPGL
jgi:hypothetical protein